MNLEFDTTFIVMPDQCNYMYPMIFGGAFFSEMDLCAAQCVSRLLHDSECNVAVTHKFEGTFHNAAECGDIIFLSSKVVELRHKAIKVQVTAHSEKRGKAGRTHLADGTFVFVTKKDGEFAHHGLKMP